MVKTQAKFDNRFHVLAYELAAQGRNDSQIAEALGVNRATLRRWLRQKPALREAVEKGRGSSGDGQTFSDYVYRRLPPELQAVWTGILQLEEWYEKAPERRAHRVPGEIEFLFSKDGRKATRQRLWFHAYVSTNFNALEACRLTNTSYQTVREQWSKDAAFKRLMDSLPQYMSAFADGAFWRGVAAGEPAMVMAAQKAFQPQLYNKPKQLNVTGNVNQLHGHVNVMEMLAAIPADKRKEALARMRQAQQLPAHEEAVT